MSRLSHGPCVIVALVQSESVLDESPYLTTATGHSSARQAASCAAILNDDFQNFLFQPTTLRVLCILYFSLIHFCLIFVVVRSSFLRLGRPFDAHVIAHGSPSRSFV